MNGFRWTLLAILAIYVGLRVFAWSNIVVFDDHDIVSYLLEAEAIRSLDLERIRATFTPDTTSMYPLATALGSGGPDGGGDSFGGAVSGAVVDHHRAKARDLSGP